MNSNKSRRLDFLVSLIVAISSSVVPLGSTSIAYAEASKQSSVGADSMGERAYAKAEWVFDHANDVLYRHYKHDAAEQVHDDGGKIICHNDCSGFSSFVIHSIAPRHYKPIRERQSERPYPQAKIYAKFFSELDPNQAHDGWVKVSNYRDLKRGDFIAWEKGDSNNDHGGKGNSGHVMIVREHPGEPYEEEIEGKKLKLVNVPVLDSSSVYHFAPETLPPNAGQEHRNGLGKGDIKLVLDERDRAIGYWEGSFWGEGNKDLKHPSMSNMIHFGRMVPESK